MDSPNELYTILVIYLDAHIHHEVRFV